MTPYRIRKGAVFFYKIQKILLAFWENIYYNGNRYFITEFIMEESLLCLLI